MKRKSVLGTNLMKMNAVYSLVIEYCSVKNTSKTLLLG